MFPIDGRLLLTCLALAIGVGLVVFHAVAGYYHLRYYVRRRDDAATWKCQPERWLKPELQREAALLSTFNLTLGGTLTGLLIYAIAKGLPMPLYYDVAEYGWPYTIASAALLFVLNDAGAYYVHRFLHRKWFFKRIHRWHHRYVATTPYVTVAVHPFELLSLQVASFLPIFIIPFHPAVIGAVLTYVLVFNIVDHSGVRLTSRIPWQGPSLFHDDHHKYFHCNFGQHLTLWDRFHGTLRRVSRRYGKEVFGGRGAPGEGSGGDDFVAY
jgi:lathosterol oxidase